MPWAARNLWPPWIIRMSRSKGKGWTTRRLWWVDSMPMHLITQAQFFPMEHTTHTQNYIYNLCLFFALCPSIYQSISHMQTVHTGAQGFHGLSGEAGVPGCCTPGAKGDKGPSGIRGLDGPSGKKIPHLMAKVTIKIPICSNSHNYVLCDIYCL